MKKILLFLAVSALTLGSPTAFAQKRREKSSCAQRARTQIEMNQCAAEAYQKADDWLNAAYQRLTAALGGDRTPSQQSLKDAHLAWIKYRDAACESEASLNAGGSLAPLTRNYCLAAVTAERTKRLQGMVKTLGAAGIRPAAPETGGARRASVTGNVFFLERIALPPTAVVNVKLLDVSRQDAAAPVLGEQTIEARGKQPPFDFEINYDAQKIIDSHRYAVRATITVDGQLWFTSTTSYPVITNGNPDKVAVRVNRARG
jgi:putative lipoprotein